MSAGGGSGRVDAGRGVRARRLLVASVRVAVAGGVLVGLARWIDVADAWASMRTAGLGYALAAFCCAAVSNLIVAYRLQLLMRAQGVALGVRETFEINLTTLFYGLFLPGGGVTGGAVRLYRLGRVGGRYGAALLAMVSDRVAAIAGISAAGLVCWALDAHERPRAGLAVLAVCATGVGAVLTPLAAPGWFRRPWRALRGRAPGWIRPPLHRLARAHAVLTGLPARVLYRLVALSLVAQLPGIVSFAILAQALDLPVSLSTVGWLRSVVILLTSVPVSIGGLGVREGALVLLLRPYGVAAHDALAFSVLIFAVTVVAVSLLGGVLEAWRWLCAAGAPPHRQPREGR